MLRHDTPRILLAQALASQCDGMYDGIDEGSRFSMFTSPEMVRREICKAIPELSAPAGTGNGADQLAAILLRFTSRPGSQWSWGLSFAADARPTRIFEALCAELPVFQEAPGKEDPGMSTLSHLEDLAAELEDLAPAGAHPSICLIDRSKAAEIAGYLRAHAQLLGGQDFSAHLQGGDLDGRDREDTAPADDGPSPG